MGGGTSTSHAWGFIVRRSEIPLSRGENYQRGCCLKNRFYINAKTACIKKEHIHRGQPGYPASLKKKEVVGKNYTGTKVIKLL